MFEKTPFFWADERNKRLCRTSCHRRDHNLCKSLKSFHNFI
jgi:hypothetical protein